MPKRTKKSKIAPIEPEMEEKIDAEADRGGRRHHEPRSLCGEPSRTIGYRSLSHAVSIYRKIALTFVFLTGALLILVIYFALSKAEIVVTPAPQELKAEFWATVEKEPLRGEATSGLVFEREVNGVKKFLASAGEGVKAPTTVTGEVTISNKTGRHQILVATTRLLSPEGILFRLKKQAVIPAGASVTAEVYADKVGTASAIPPTKFTIPGLPRDLQDDIYAESLEKFTGGEATLAAITEEAADKAALELAAELRDDVVAGLRKETGAKRFSGEVFKAEIVEREVSPALGTVAPGGEVRIRVRLQAVFYEREKILVLGQAHLEEQLKADKRLKEIASDKMTVTVETVEAQKGTARLKIILIGKAVISSSSPLFDKARLAGEPLATIKEKMLQSSDIERVEINIRPFWAPKMPVLKDHIEVIIR